MLSLSNCIVELVSKLLFVLQTISELNTIKKFNMTIWLDLSQIQVNTSLGNSKFFNFLDNFVSNFLWWSFGHKLNIRPAFKKCPFGYTCPEIHSLCKIGHLVKFVPISIINWKNTKVVELYTQFSYSDLFKLPEPNVVSFFSLSNELHLPQISLFFSLKWLWSMIETWLRTQYFFVIFCDCLNVSFVTLPIGKPCLTTFWSVSNLIDCLLFL